MFPDYEREWSMSADKTLAKKLLRHFIAAAGVLALAEAWHLYGDLGNTGTPLTREESNFVKSVFGDQINTASIRKYFKPGSGEMFGLVKATSRRHVSFFGEQNHSVDYSLEGNGLRGKFMHEMTHLWQNQAAWLLTVNAVRVLNCERPDIRLENNALVVASSKNKYAYELGKQSSFDDFCVEPQAEIIKHYVTRVLYPESGGPGLLAESEADADLIRVVEDKFPQAKLTREKLESEYLKRISGFADQQQPSI